MKPFYRLDEMTCELINIGLIGRIFYQAKKKLLKDDELMANICDTIQKIDNSSDLITHQDHIIKKS